MRRPLVIAAAVVTGIVILYGVAGLVIPRAERKPAVRDLGRQVIAHQGGNHLRPDNTMVAFRNAVELGVDALEMDVHATADGVLVVIHDETVDRTTNGSGAVRDLTFEELRALDAAYHWPHHLDTTVHPYRGQGVVVPTLEEVLRAFPDVPMTIEIKQSEPSIVDAFGRMLQRFDREQNTIVASFHPDVMREFRAKFPDFATSGVEPEIRTFYVLKTVFLGWLYRPPMEAFQVPEASGNLKVITPRFVRAAHRRGVDVHVWTVNDRESALRVLGASVDGIITDRPDLILEILDREP
ncbi:MAG: glycerophosphodiester phosphodiesterase [Spirochaetota bacterium]